MYMRKFASGDDFLKNYLKQTISALLCFVLIFASGCGKKEEETTIKPKAQKDYDIFIYNTDTNIAAPFKEMCDEYTSRTGVIIKTVTTGADENGVEELTEYMNSDNPPDIFTINNLAELQQWKESANVLDFSNATQENFKTIVNEIPESLRLSSNTSDSYGLPYTVEAYGFLVDPKMLSSLFGGDKYRTALNDLQVCSYEDFHSFVETLKLYIRGSGGYEFDLNGKTYTFVNQKGDLSQNLNGVFSFAAGTSNNTGNYMANLALAAVYESAAAANITTDSQINSLKYPLLGFAEALDMITSSVSGKTGPISRGLEIVSNSQNSHSQSLKNFASGKSVFLLGGTKDYNELTIYNSSVSKRCVFIPIKMPFLDQDIKASKISVKNFNNSIPVYAPKYYSINAKSPEREQKLAQDFLVWLKTSELAAQYIIPDFNFVPYDIKESSVIDNSLSRSMIEYMSSNRTLPGVFYGAPQTWAENLSKLLAEQFFTKVNWSYADYEKIADHGIKTWKELKK